jgi:hypothetical protein
VEKTRRAMVRAVTLAENAPNDLLGRICLAVLLVASAEANELVSPDSDGCTYENLRECD